MIYNDASDIQNNQPLFCGMATEIIDDPSTENVLLHLVGCQLFVMIPDVLCALRESGIEPYHTEEYTNDWVLGLKKQQIKKAAAVVYAALLQKRKQEEHK